jgi:hypothetical protein
MESRPVPKSSKRKADTRSANKDRKQRLEELRRQQRASERRKNLIFTGSAIAVAVILIAAAVIPTYLHDRAQKAKEKAGYQAAPTAAEQAAGCTGVHNDPVSVGGSAVHTQDVIDYSKEPYGDTAGGTPPIPPSGGRHNPTSLGTTTRFYPLSADPQPERAVHDLEHGFIVGWYDKDLPADQVSKLQALAQDPSLTRFLAVGWTPGDGVLPAGKHFVLTSWGRTDRCSSVSADVVKQFVTSHLNSSLAPEAGLGPTSNADQCDPSKLDCIPTATSPPTPLPSPSKS